MNYSKYRFNLDMQSNISQVSLPVRQGDTSVNLYIGLTMDGGNPYLIEEGCRAVFVAKKADGNLLINDCMIEKGTTIRYTLTQQTTSFPGVTDCEIRLYGADGNVITTPRFILVVYERVAPDEDIVLSETEKTVIDNIISTEQDRVIAEAERVARSQLVLDKAYEAVELVDELQERLNATDFAENEIAVHNASPNAHTVLFGEGNKKGIKGYWIKNVADAGFEESRYIVFHNTTVRAEATKPGTSGSPWKNPMSIPYAVGDEFSVITPKDHYHFCGKILGISEEFPVGTYSCWVEFYTDINWNAGDPVDNNDYAFFVPAKPDLGIIDVSNGGFATGYYTRAGGDDTHSEGVYTQAIGSYSHAEGLETWAGYSAHAEGSDTKAIGKYAHAEGFTTTAKGGSSHAEGELTEANGFASHTEGKETVTSGAHSHAEGWKTQAQADNSHAEGLETKAEGGNSHAENSYNRAIGVDSHAGGSWSNAIGNCSFAHGDSCSAHSDKSVAFGYFTETSSNQPSQFAMGELNKIVDHALLMVGNGASTGERTNAFTVKSQGRGNGANVSMVLGKTEMSEAKFKDVLALAATEKRTVGGYIYTSSDDYYLYLPFEPGAIIIQSDYYDTEEFSGMEAGLSLGVWINGQDQMTGQYRLSTQTNWFTANVTSVKMNDGSYRVTFSFSSGMGLELISDRISYIAIM